MKINVKQPILDYEGNPLLVEKRKTDGSVIVGEDGVVEKEQETLRSYIILSLNNAAQGEEFTPEQKATIYRLSTKIYKSNDVNFTSEDVVFVKERVGKIYGPLVYGRVCDMLEGTEISLPEDTKDDEPKADKVAITGKKEANAAA